MDREARNSHRVSLKRSFHVLARKRADELVHLRRIADSQWQSRRFAFLTRSPFAKGFFAVRGRPDLLDDAPSSVTEASARLALRPSSVRYSPTSRGSPPQRQDDAEHRQHARPIATGTMLKSRITPLARLPSPSGTMMTPARTAIIGCSLLVFDVEAVHGSLLSWEAPRTSSRESARSRPHSEYEVT